MATKTKSTKRTMTKKEEISYEIIETYGELNRNEDGTVRKEFGLVSWNDNEAKLDLRDWIYDEDGNIVKCRKGITVTLSDFEQMILFALKSEVFDEEFLNEVKSVLASNEENDEDDDELDDDEDYEEDENEEYDEDDDEEDDYEDDEDDDDLDDDEDYEEDEDEEDDEPVPPKKSSKRRR